MWQFPGNFHLHKLREACRLEEDRYSRLLNGQPAEWVAPDASSLTQILDPQGGTIVQQALVTPDLTFQVKHAILCSTAAFVSAVSLHTFPKRVLTLPGSQEDTKV